MFPNLKRQFQRKSPSEDREGAHSDSLEREKKKNQVTQKGMKEKKA